MNSRPFPKRGVISHYIGCLYVGFLKSETYGQYVYNNKRGKITLEDWGQLKAVSFHNLKK